MRFAKLRSKPASDHSRMRVGYAPALHCAPVIAAQELGLFMKYGLDVTLERALGLGSLREKLIHEELDAVLMDPVMGLRAYHGQDSIRRHCVCPLIVASNPCPVVLGKAMSEGGSSDVPPRSRSSTQGGASRELVLGSVQGAPSHERCIRAWLTDAGFSGVAVRWVQLPSPLLYESLQAGLIDAFSGAEPWCSLAVSEGLGSLAAGNAKQAWSRAACGLFLLNEDVAQDPDRATRLTAALIEAGGFCDAEANHDWMASTLSASHYLNVPARSISAALRRGAQPGTQAAVASASPGFRFHRNDTGCPSRERVKDLITGCAAPDDAGATSAALARIFRDDIHLAALSMIEGAGVCLNPVRGRGAADVRNAYPLSPLNTPTIAPATTQ